MASIIFTLLDVGLGSSFSDLGARSGEVRFAPLNRHRQLEGLRPRSANERGHSITSSAQACAGSFGQPRFPKALNQQLRI